MNEKCNVPEHYLKRETDTKSIHFNVIDPGLLSCDAGVTL
jgi:hypothetical protein